MVSQTAFHAHALTCGLATRIKEGITTQTEEMPLLNKPTSIENSCLLPYCLKSLLYINDL